MRKSLIALSIAILSTASVYAQETNLYWGDTHLHTKLSGDAYLMQNRSLGPDDAYRYAKGLPVVNALSKHIYSGWYAARFFSGIRSRRIFGCY